MCDCCRCRRVDNQSRLCCGWTLRCVQNAPNSLNGVLHFVNGYAVVAHLFIDFINTCSFCASGSCGGHGGRGTGRSRRRRWWESSVAHLELCLIDAHGEPLHH